jgi:hypothetical protein
MRCLMLTLRLLHWHVKHALIKLTAQRQVCSAIAAAIVMRAIP